jgi:hypothetical protein
MGRDARLKPIFSTALHGPGPGSYFHQRKADVEKEIAAKRNLSRISIASSRSRLSLSRERSREIAQSLAPKGGTRRTFLDDAQLHASRLPGPGAIFRPPCSLLYVTGLVSAFCGFGFGFGLLVS